MFPFEVRCLLLGALWSALPPLPLPPLALSAARRTTAAAPTVIEALLQLAAVTAASMQ